MPIQFKSKLSSSIANLTFLDKTIDDATVGKFSLRESSTPDIEDIQAFLNTLRGDVDSNDVELADHEARLVVNEAQLVDHETRIGDNETLLVNHEDRITVNESEIQDIEDSVGAANGIAPLDANSEVPLANLPQSVQDGLSPQGNWDASTNTPDLVTATPNAGEYWIVNVAGTTNLGGITDWGLNDWAVYTVSGWAKMDFSNSVVSVNGQTGSVVLDKTDIGLSNLSNDAQLKREDADFDSFTEKTTPVDADIVLIEDSEDSFSKKKVLLSNMLGGGGGGGGSFVWELNGDISPLEETISGISVLSFESEIENEIWAFIQVPTSYGTDQIKLNGLSFTSADASDNVLFRCQTFLNRSGQSINYENYISTNTELTLTSANIVNVIDEIDLTDVNGQINFVQVLPNDYLAIRLYRDIANETVSSTEYASMIKFSASVSFTA